MEVCIDLRNEASTRGFTERMLRNTCHVAPNFSSSSHAGAAHPVFADPKPATRLLPSTTTQMHASPPKLDSACQTRWGPEAPLIVSAGRVLLVKHAQAKDSVITTIGMRPCCGASMVDVLVTKLLP